MIWAASEMLSGLLFGSDNDGVVVSSSSGMVVFRGRVVGSTTFDVVVVPTVDVDGLVNCRVL